MLTWFHWVGSVPGSRLEVEVEGAEPNEGVTSQVRISGWIKSQTISEVLQNKIIKKFKTQNMYVT